MVRPVFQWTDQALAELRRLHAGGFSFSQIAAAIGCPSRNAVIGKANRIGLVRAQQPEKPKALAVAHRARSKKLPPDLPATREERRQRFQSIADQAVDRFERTVAPSAKPVRFIERGHFQCAMPQPGWDEVAVTEKMVCGAPVVAGTSWCAACLQIVGVPPAFTRYKTAHPLKGVAA